MAKETISLVGQLIKKLGLPTENGLLKSSRGKYYFVTEKTKKQIFINTSSEAELTKLVGKKVIAILSGNSIVTLFPYQPPVGWKPRRILCYYPPPDIIKRIDPQVERTIRDQFVKEGIISKIQAETLDQIESFRH